MNIVADFVTFEIEEITEDYFLVWTRFNDLIDPFFDRNTGVPSFGTREEAIEYTKNLSKKVKIYKLLESHLGVVGRGFETINAITRDDFAAICDELAKMIA